MESPKLHQRCLMEFPKSHHRSTLLTKALKPLLLEFSGQVSRWVSLSGLLPLYGHCPVVVDGRANTDTRMMDAVKVRKARSFQLSKPNIRTTTATSNRPIGCLHCCFAGLSCPVTHLHAVSITVPP